MAAAGGKRRVDDSGDGDVAKRARVADDPLAGARAGAPAGATLTRRQAPKRPKLVVAKNFAGLRAEELVDLLIANHKELSVLAAMPKVTAKLETEANKRSAYQEALEAQIRIALKDKAYKAPVDPTRAARERRREEQERAAIEKAAKEEAKTEKKRQKDADAAEAARTGKGVATVAKLRKAAEAKAASAVAESAAKFDAVAGVSPTTPDTKPPAPAKKRAPRKAAPKQGPARVVTVKREDDDETLKPKKRKTERQKLTDAKIDPEASLTRRERATYLTEIRMWQALSDKDPREIQAPSYMSEIVPSAEDDSVIYMSNRALAWLQKTANDYTPLEVARVGEYLRATDTLGPRVTRTLGSADGVIMTAYGRAIPRESRDVYTPSRKIDAYALGINDALYGPEPFTIENADVKEWKVQYLDTDRGCNVPMIRSAAPSNAVMTALFDATFRERVCAVPAVVPNNRKNWGMHGGRCVWMMRVNIVDETSKAYNSNAYYVIRPGTNEWWDYIFYTLGSRDNSDRLDEAKEKKALLPGEYTGFIQAMSYFTGLDRPLMGIDLGMPLRKLKRPADAARNGRSMWDTEPPPAGAWTLTLEKMREYVRRAVKRNFEWQAIASRKNAKRDCSSDLDVRVLLTPEFADVYPKMPEAKVVEQKDAAAAAEKTMQSPEAMRVLRARRTEQFVLYGHAPDRSDASNPHRLRLERISVQVAAVIGRHADRATEDIEKKRTVRVLAAVKARDDAAAAFVATAGNIDMSFEQVEQANEAATAAEAYADAMQRSVSPPYPQLVDMVAAIRTHAHRFHRFLREGKATGVDFVTGHDAVFTPDDFVDWLVSYTPEAVDGARKRVADATKASIEAAAAYATATQERKRASDLKVGVADAELKMEASRKASDAAGAELAAARTNDDLIEKGAKGQGGMTAMRAAVLALVALYIKEANEYHDAGAAAGDAGAAVGVRFADPSMRLLAKVSAAEVKFSRAMLDYAARWFVIERQPPPGENALWWKIGRAASDAKSATSGFARSMLVPETIADPFAGSGAGTPAKLPDAVLSEPSDEVHARAFGWIVVMNYLEARLQSSPFIVAGERDVEAWTAMKRRARLFVPDSPDEANLAHVISESASRLDSQLATVASATGLVDGLRFQLGRSIIAVVKDSIEVVALYIILASERAMWRLCDDAAAAEVAAAATAAAPIAPIRRDACGVTPLAYAALDEYLWNGKWPAMVRDLTIEVTTTGADGAVASKSYSVEEFMRDDDDGPVGKGHAVRANGILDFAFGARVERPIDKYTTTVAAGAGTREEALYRDVWQIMLALTSRLTDDMRVKFSGQIDYDLVSQLTGPAQQTYFGPVARRVGAGRATIAAPPAVPASSAALLTLPETAEDKKLREEAEAAKYKAAEAKRKVEMEAAQAREVRKRKLASGILEPELQRDVEAKRKQAKAERAQAASTDAMRRSVANLSHLRRTRLRDYVTEMREAKIPGSEGLPRGADGTSIGMNEIPTERQALDMVRAIIQYGIPSRVLYAYGMPEFKGKVRVVDVPPVPESRVAGKDDEYDAKVRANMAALMANNDEARRAASEKVQLAEQARLLVRSTAQLSVDGIRAAVASAPYMSAKVVATENKRLVLLDLAKLDERQIASMTEALKSCERRPSGIDEDGVQWMDDVLIRMRAVVGLKQKRLNYYARAFGNIYGRGSSGGGSGEGKGELVPADRKYDAIDMDDLSDIRARRFISSVINCGVPESYLFAAEYTEPDPSIVTPLDEGVSPVDTTEDGDDPPDERVPADAARYHKAQSEWEQSALRMRGAVRGLQAENGVSGMEVYEKVFKAEALESVRIEDEERRAREYEQIMEVGFTDHNADLKRKYTAYELGTLVVANTGMMSAGVMDRLSLRVTQLANELNSLGVRGTTKRAAASAVIGAFYGDRGVVPDWGRGLAAYHNARAANRKDVSLLWLDSPLLVRHPNAAAVPPPPAPAPAVVEMSGFVLSAERTIAIPETWQIEDTDTTTYTREIPDVENSKVEYIRREEIVEVVPAPAAPPAPPAEGAEAPAAAAVEAPVAAAAPAAAAAPLEAETKTMTRVTRMLIVRGKKYRPPSADDDDDDGGAGGAYADVAADRNVKRKGTEAARLRETEEREKTKAARRRQKTTERYRARAEAQRTAQANEELEDAQKKQLRMRSVSEEYDGVYEEYAARLKLYGEGSQRAELAALVATMRTNSLVARDAGPRESMQLDATTFDAIVDASDLAMYTERVQDYDKQSEHIASDKADVHEALDTLKFVLVDPLRTVPAEFQKYTDGVTAQQKGGALAITSEQARLAALEEVVRSSKRRELHRRYARRARVGALKATIDSLLQRHKDAGIMATDLIAYSERTETAIKSAREEAQLARAKDAAERIATLKSRVLASVGMDRPVVEEIECRAEMMEALALNEEGETTRPGERVMSSYARDRAKKWYDSYKRAYGGVDPVTGPRRKLAPQTLAELTDFAALFAPDYPVELSTDLVEAINNDGGNLSDIAKAFTAWCGASFKAVVAVSTEANDDDEDVYGDFGVKQRAKRQKMEERAKRASARVYTDKRRDFFQVKRVALEAAKHIAELDAGELATTTAHIDRMMRSLKSDSLPYRWMFALLSEALKPVQENRAARDLKSATGASAILSAMIAGASSSAFASASNGDRADAAIELIHSLDSAGVYTPYVQGVVNNYIDQCGVDWKDGAVADRYVHPDRYAELVEEFVEHLLIGAANPTKVDPETRAVPPVPPVPPVPKPPQPPVAAPKPPRPPARPRPSSSSSADSKRVGAAAPAPGDGSDDDDEDDDDDEPVQESKPAPVDPDAERKRANDAAAAWREGAARTIDAWDRIAKDAPRIGFFLGKVRNVIPRGVRVELVLAVQDALRADPPKFPAKVLDALRAMPKPEKFLKGGEKLQRKKDESKAAAAAREATDNQQWSDNALEAAVAVVNALTAQSKLARDDIRAADRLLSGIDQDTPRTMPIIRYTGLYGADDEGKTEKPTEADQTATPEYAIAAMEAAVAVLSDPQYRPSEEVSKQVDEMLKEACISPLDRAIRKAATTAAEWKFLNGSRDETAPSEAEEMAARDDPAKKAAMAARVARFAKETKEANNAAMLAQRRIARPNSVSLAAKRLRDELGRANARSDASIAAAIRGSKESAMWASQTDAGDQKNSVAELAQYKKQVELSGTYDQIRQRVDATAIRRTVAVPVVQQKPSPLPDDRADDFDPDGEEPAFRIYARSSDVRSVTEDMLSINKDTLAFLNREWLRFIPVVYTKVGYMYSTLTHRVLLTASNNVMPATANASIRTYLTALYTESKELKDMHDDCVEIERVIASVLGSRSPPTIDSDGAMLHKGVSTQLLPPDIPHDRERAASMAWAHSPDAKRALAVDTSDTAAHSSMAKHNLVVLNGIRKAYGGSVAYRPARSAMHVSPVVELLLRARRAHLIRRLHHLCDDVRNVSWKTVYDLVPSALFAVVVMNLMWNSRADGRHREMRCFWEWYVNMPLVAFAQPHVQLYLMMHGKGVSPEERGLSPDTFERARFAGIAPLSLSNPLFMAHAMHDDFHDALVARVLVDRYPRPADVPAAGPNEAERREARNADRRAREARVETLTQELAKPRIRAFFRDAFRAELHTETVQLELLEKQEAVAARLDRIRAERPAYQTQIEQLRGATGAAWTPAHAHAMWSIAHMRRAVSLGQSETIDQVNDAAEASEPVIYATAARVFALSSLLVTAGDKALRDTLPTAVAILAAARTPHLAELSADIDVASNIADLWSVETSTACGIVNGLWSAVHRCFRVLGPEANGSIDTPADERYFAIASAFLDAARSTEAAGLRTKCTVRRPYDVLKEYEVSLRQARASLVLAEKAAATMRGGMATSGWTGRLGRERSRVVQEYMPSLEVDGARKLIADMYDNENDDVRLAADRATVTADMITNAGQSIVNGIANAVEAKIKEVFDAGAPVPAPDDPVFVQRTLRATDWLADIYEAALDAIETTNKTYASYLAEHAGDSASTDTIYTARRELLNGVVEKARREARAAWEATTYAAKLYTVLADDERPDSVKRAEFERVAASAVEKIRAAAREGKPASIYAPTPKPEDDDDERVPVDETSDGDAPTAGLEGDTPSFIDEGLDGDDEGEGKEMAKPSRRIRIEDEEAPEGESDAVDMLIKAAIEMPEHPEGDYKDLLTIETERREFLDAQWEAERPDLLERLASLDKAVVNERARVLMLQTGYDNQSLTKQADAAAYSTALRGDRTALKYAFVPSEDDGYDVYRRRFRAYETGALTRERIVFGLASLVLGAGIEGRNNGRVCVNRLCVAIGLLPDREYLNGERFVLEPKGDNTSDEYAYKCVLYVSDVARAAIGASRTALARATYRRNEVLAVARQKMQQAWIVDAETPFVDEVHSGHAARVRSFVSSMQQPAWTVDACARRVGESDTDYEARTRSFARLEQSGGALAAVCAAAIAVTIDKLNDPIDAAGTVKPYLTVARNASNAIVAECLDAERPRLFAKAIGAYATLCSTTRAAIYGERKAAAPNVTLADIEAVTGSAARVYLRRRALERAMRPVAAAAAAPLPVAAAPGGDSKEAVAAAPLVAEADEGGVPDRLPDDPSVLQGLLESHHAFRDRRAADPSVAIANDTDNLWEVDKAFAVAHVELLKWKTKVGKAAIKRIDKVLSELVERPTRDPTVSSETAILVNSQIYDAYALTERVLSFATPSDAKSDPAVRAVLLPTPETLRLRVPNLRSVRVGVQTSMPGFTRNSDLEAYVRSSDSKRVQACGFVSDADVAATAAAMKVAQGACTACGRHDYLWACPTGAHCVRTLCRYCFMRHLRMNACGSSTLAEARLGEYTGPLFPVHTDDGEYAATRQSQLVVSREVCDPPQQQPGSGVVAHNDGELPIRASDTAFVRIFGLAEIADDPAPAVEGAPTCADCTRRTTTWKTCADCDRNVCGWCFMRHLRYASCTHSGADADARNNRTCQSCYRVVGAHASCITNCRRDGICKGCIGRFHGGGLNCDVPLTLSAADGVVARAGVMAKWRGLARYTDRVDEARRARVATALTSAWEESRLRLTAYESDVAEHLQLTLASTIVAMDTMPDGDIGAAAGDAARSLAEHYAYAFGSDNGAKVPASSSSTKKPDDRVQTFVVRAATARYHAAATKAKRLLDIAGDDLVAASPEWRKLNPKVTNARDRLAAEEKLARAAADAPSADAKAKADAKATADARVEKARAALTKLEGELAAINVKRDPVFAKYEARKREHRDADGAYDAAMKAARDAPKGTREEAAKLAAEAYMTSRAAAIAADAARAATAAPVAVQATPLVEPFLPVPVRLSSPPAAPAAPAPPRVVSLSSVPPASRS